MDDEVSSTWLEPSILPRPIWTRVVEKELRGKLEKPAVLKDSGMLRFSFQHRLPSIICSLQNVRSLQMDEMAKRPAPSTISSVYRFCCLPAVHFPSLCHHYHTLGWFHVHLLFICLHTFVAQRCFLKLSTEISIRQLFNLSYSILLYHTLSYSIAADNNFWRHSGQPFCKIGEISTVYAKLILQTVKEAYWPRQTGMEG